jgi:hypothetical protein
MKKAMMMMVGGVSTAMAEQVPVEVQQAIDNAMSGKDPQLVSFCVDHARSGYKLSDVKTGEPIHLYGFI